MSHWKWTRLLSGNLNMENSLASAVPASLSYWNWDMMDLSGQPLWSTSSTVVLRSEKLKHLLTRIPTLPSYWEMWAL